MTAESVMRDIDAYVYSVAAAPWRGWHDDYRGKDRTPLYMPALQQVKGEFEDFVRVILATGKAQKALQLGLGESGAAHVAWRQIFGFVCSVDVEPQALENLRSRYLLGPGDVLILGDTHAPATLMKAAQHGPYDMLFIDAGHTKREAMRDYQDYAPLVRRGGIVAFHDSLPRKGYEKEIEVWQVIDALSESGERWATVGAEVGISYRL